MIGGLNGYDTKGVFTGAQPVRDGRQKGSKAYTSSPNFTGKIDYYGIKNLSLGLSYYGGESQSKLYGNLNDDDAIQQERADSSVVGMNMIGADVRYNIKGLTFTGQFYYTAFSNTEEYNHFTRSGAKNNDLGNSLVGYYGEVGYNVLQHFSNSKMELIPFFRYEAYDLHNSVDNVVAKNDKYDVTILTGGLTYKLTKGAVLKSDLQVVKSKAGEYSKVFSAGIGVMF